jgi:hypothetical protein
VLAASVAAGFETARNALPDAVAALGRVILCDSRMTHSPVVPFCSMRACVTLHSVGGAARFVQGSRRF